MPKMTGLKEFQRKLNDMAKRAEQLNGTHSVPITELLTSEFLRRCSRFSSADELFQASGFKIESAEDFDAIPEAEWDTFIAVNTTFASWKAMAGDATGRWALRRLGL